jgi:phosphohistidine phosphatase
MHLFIIRHAEAAPRSKDIDDSARPLTDRGRRQWRRAASGLEWLGVHFDRLYHSPWLRAVETANALAGLVKTESVVMQQLARPPNRALMAALQGERVGVVGHQPWLTQLAALAAFGHPAQGERIELKKGGMIWLEGEPRPGHMMLRALLPPKVLRPTGAAKSAGTRK